MSRPRPCSLNWQLCALAVPSFLTISLLTTGLIASSAAIHAADTQWPQFLGPNRDGKTSQSGLIDSFADGGPKVRWSVPGGVGMSAVAVDQGQAVTMWNTENEQQLVSLDSATGKLNWSVALGPAYKNAQGDGPRSTPLIDGDQVFAFTGNGLLACVDLQTGNIIWRNDVVAQLQTKSAEYGMASSPLKVGELIVVHVGAADATIAAVDAATGTIAWTAGQGAAGYSSPARMKLDGVDQIVSLTASGAWGLEPATGNVLWSYPFKTPYDCNTANPVNIDGGVFLSAGENHGCVLLDIKKQDGAFKVTQRWASVDTKSVMRNEWQTSIVVDGYLYGFDNVGSAGPTTHLSCIRADTGDPVWQQTRFGKGNLVLADGKLWITTMKGELVLVKVSAESYQELGRAQLFKKTRQSLSIADGYGYIRDDQNVYCIELK
ncbi:MAG: PQQ-binding-like beta-propeller repeat protein [Pirellulaceae bacterium]|nr:PQQ-binding-like beta-propeller repeat protein [Pirellulaceae bacterium]